MRLCTIIFIRFIRHFKDCRQHFNPFESQQRSAPLLELRTQNIYPINSASTGNNSLSFKLQTLSVSAGIVFCWWLLFFWGGWGNPFGEGSSQVSFPLLNPFKFLCSVELSLRVWLRCGFCLTWVGTKMESDIVQALESCTCSFLWVFSTLCFLHLTLSSLFSVYNWLSQLSLNSFFSLSLQRVLSLLSCFFCLKCFEQNEIARSFCNQIYRNSPLRSRYSPLSPLQILCSFVLTPRGECIEKCRAIRSASIRITHAMHTQQTLNVKCASVCAPVCVRVCTCVWQVK